MALKRTELKRKTPLRSRPAKPKAGTRERKALPQRKPMKVKRSPKLNATAAEKRHMARIAAMPCLVTKRTDVVLHHIMKCPGKTKRRDHRFVVPLVAEYHNMGNRSVHLLGSEEAFKREHGIDLAEWAVQEWERSCAIERRMA